MRTRPAHAPDPYATELPRLLAGEHPNPHHFLGYHTDGRPEVRVYRPGAAAVRVLLTDGSVRAMTRVDPAGVFAAEVPELAVDGYELEIDLADDRTLRTGDPYRFWPTLGELDLHYIGEGRHHDLWGMLGARIRVHQGSRGTSFAVWAPSAQSVRVVGDFNDWDTRMHPMRVLGSSGIWEIFLPGVEAGARYKFAILTQAHHLLLKADPMAFQTEVPPGTASVVSHSEHTWGDQAWCQARDQRRDRLAQPISIYECHLGSWRRTGAGEGAGGGAGGGPARPLTYRELAEQLPEYLADLGFTHVELLPVAEHPYGGSWGYQVSSYFAPTARHGTPDDFRALVDALHQKGIGVILDWVPAHFPKDDWALARFDGTALYEHADPRRSEHPDWGTLVFNFGRHEVRNFLLSNALFWIEEYHVDGLRVDAVASMLYLDYSRGPGQWVPNQFGGREDLEAVSFIKEFNEVVYRLHPGVMTVAEESTAWPAVSRPTYLGGLGFGFKWNMGWMHDTLAYFSKDPVYRRFHHDHLTFGLVYAFSENYVLPLSHDEVVHGKASLLWKMPGDRWRQFANLRALFGWMWAHPGKQLLFMGCELAQDREWSEAGSLDWDLLQHDEHRGVQDLVRRLNRVYQATPALWERDFSSDGFRWINASDTDNSVMSFLRLSADGRHLLACVANLTPVPHYGYRLGLPVGGRWAEVVNTDAVEYGGSGMGNLGGVWAEDQSGHGLPFSVPLVLPPLAVLWLVPEPPA